MAILLFNKYSYSEISIKDVALENYINIETELINPHSGAQFACKAFGKKDIPIVERFICYFMRKGRNTGKKQLVTNAVKTAFHLIEQMTKSNPLQVLSDAICNAAPREESARIGRGGSAKLTSVTPSSYRRVNLGLLYITKGIRERAFKKRKSISEVIADEVIATAKNTTDSYAVNKKIEVEKIAKSNR